MFPAKTTIHDDGTIVTLYEGAPCDDAAFQLDMRGPVDGILKPYFDPITRMIHEKAE